MYIDHCSGPASACVHMITFDSNETWIDRENPFCVSDRQRVRKKTKTMLFVVCDLLACEVEEVEEVEDRTFV